MVGGTDPMAEPDEFLRQIEDYAGLGVSKVWLSTPADSVDPVRWVEQVGTEIVPRISAV